jgi:hypothetical protein
VLCCLQDELQQVMAKDMNVSTPAERLALANVHAPVAAAAPAATMLNTAAANPHQAQQQQAATQQQEQAGFHGVLDDSGLGSRKQSPLCLAGMTVEQVRVFLDEGYEIVVQRPRGLRSYLSAPEIVGLAAPGTQQRQSLQLTDNLPGNPSQTTAGPGIRNIVPSTADRQLGSGTAAPTAAHPRAAAQSPGGFSWDAEMVYQQAAFSEQHQQQALHARTDASSATNAARAAQAMHLYQALQMHQSEAAICPGRMPGLATNFNPAASTAMAAAPGPSFAGMNQLFDSGLAGPVYSQHQQQHLLLPTSAHTVQFCHGVTMYPGMLTTQPQSRILTMAAPNAAEMSTAAAAAAYNQSHGAGVNSVLVQQTSEELIPTMQLQLNNSPNSMAAGGMQLPAMGTTAQSIGSMPAGNWQGSLADEQAPWGINQHLQHTMKAQYSAFLNSLTPMQPTGAALAGSGAAPDLEAPALPRDRGQRRSLAAAVSPAKKRAKSAVRRGAGDLLDAEDFDDFWQRLGTPSPDLHAEQQQDEAAADTQDDDDVEGFIDRCMPALPDVHAVQQHEHCPEVDDVSPGRFNTCLGAASEGDDECFQQQVQGLHSPHLSMGIEAELWLLQQLQQQQPQQQGQLTPGVLQPSVADAVQATAVATPPGSSVTAVTADPVAAGQAQHTGKTSAADAVTAGPAAVVGPMPGCHVPAADAEGVTCQLPAADVEERAHNDVLMQRVQQLFPGVADVLALSQAQAQQIQGHQLSLSPALVGLTADLLAFMSAALDTTPTSNSSARAAAAAAHCKEASGPRRSTGCRL